VGVKRQILMMSGKLQITTLSSTERVFKLVVFTIPFKAATISNNFIMSKIPKLSAPELVT